MIQQVLSLLDNSGNASFTGAVTATSGSFTGTITASGGSFTGEVNVASNLVIDTWGGTLLFGGGTTRDNILIGPSDSNPGGSLSNVSTSADNIAIGSWALTAATDAGFNIAIGQSAMRYIAQGSGTDYLDAHANVAIGLAALEGLFVLPLIRAD